MALQTISACILAVNCSLRNEIITRTGRRSQLSHDGLIIVYGNLDTAPSPNLGNAIGNSFVIPANLATQDSLLTLFRLQVVNHFSLRYDNYSACRGTRHGQTIYGEYL